MTTTRWTRRTRTALAAAAVLSLVVLTACGTRTDHAAVEAVGNGYGPVDAAQDRAAAAQAATNQGAVPAPGAVADPNAAQPAPGQQPVAGQPVGGAQVPTGDQNQGTNQASGNAQNQGGEKQQPSGQTKASAADAPCTSQIAPIVLGQTLASSGLVGAAIGGLRTGLAVWAADVNARGGVQCHPVQIIQLDDASDPARVSANWNSLTKDKGAIAIVGAGVPIAIAALRSAAERDKMPVVGGDITAEDWTQSPYLFPTGGAPLTSYDGGVVDAANAVDGQVKTGLFYCVEASICTGLKNNFTKSTERAGAELGPIQAVSLTQPNFTAECQRMKDAGVNVIFYGLDGSASIRATRSCASLDYFPTIATGAIAVSAAAAADQGLRRNKTFLGSGIVPYTTTDSAGVKAFHAAFARYAPSASEDQQALLGWAAGKLFEAALAEVADKARAGNVTTQMVLDGLWQLENETLDGLGPGATFTKGKPAKAVDCYYGLRLDEKGFGAVNGSEPVCYGESRNLAAAPAVPNDARPDVGPALAARTATAAARTTIGRRRGARP